MKHLILFISMLLSFIYSYGYDSVLDQSVKDMKGGNKSLKGLIDTEDGHATLFVFWKTCCPTNLTMIDGLYEIAEENDEKDKLKIILVSVDDIKTSNRVPTVVGYKGWESEVLVDPNMELARALMVKIPPQWVAFDDKDEIFIQGKSWKVKPMPRFIMKNL